MSKSKLLGFLFAFALLLPSWVRAQTAPVITTQPTAQLAVSGTNVTFTVVATGSPTPTYQWSKGGVALSDAVGHISGSATATLTITAATAAADAGNYSVAITNTSGTITSNTVGLDFITAATANAATGIMTNAFTANWNAVPGATGYVIDVATSRTFGNAPTATPSSYVAGYQAKDAGSGTSLVISGLPEDTTYFYRIRPYNSVGVGNSSTNSSVIAVRTSASSSGPSGIALLSETFPNATATYPISGPPVVGINDALATDSNTYSIPTATQGAWFSGGTGNINYVQNLMLGTSAGSSRGILVYFSPASSAASLAIGETLSATVRLKFTDASGTPTANLGNLRFALLNSNSNGNNYNVSGSNATNNPARLTAQNFSVTNDVHARGYSGYIVETTVAQAAPAVDSVAIWRRVQATWPNDGTTANSGTTSGSQQWVGPNASSTSVGALEGITPPTVPTFVQVGAAGGGAVPAMPNDGSDYLFNISVKYTSASQVDITYTLTKAGAVLQTYSVSQTSGTLYTAFDTFFLMTNTSTVTSVAGLTVAKLPALPTITTQPSSQSVTAGANVSFTVAATSTDTLTYQWQKRVSGGSFTNITGETSATLSLTGVGASDAADYQVIVSNSGGSVTSNVATLSVAVPPAAPVADAATAVTPTGFTANWETVSGATGYRLDVSTISDFSSFVTGYQDLDVGTNLTQVVSGLSEVTTYYYRVRAVNGGGTSASSNKITAQTSASLPNITTQPSDQSVTVGSNVTFSVTATSVTTLSYQWQAQPSGGSFADISGETSSTLTLNNVQMADSGTAYRVILTNAGGPVTSSVATLTVTAASVPPSITTPPQSQSVPLGGTVTLSVVASGTGPFTYVWMNGSTVVTDAASHISGSATASLTISNVQLADGGSYTVTVSHGSDSITSAPAVLTVIPPPAAPTASAATAVSTNGFTANWTTVSGATGYRIDVATDNAFANLVTGYNNLDAGNVLTANVSGLSANTAYYYRVRAYNTAGASSSSNTIMVTTKPPMVTTTYVSSPSDLTWYKSRTADSITVGSGTVAFTEGGTSGSTYVTNFSDITLATGEVLTATIGFTTGTSVQSATSNSFRWGLANSAGTLVSANFNSSSPPNSAFLDDAAYMFDYNFSGSSPALRARNAYANNQLISSSADYTLLSSTTSGTIAALAPSTAYVLTITLEKTADGYNVTALLNGGAVSNYSLTAVDTTSTTTHALSTFNEFAFYINGGTGATNGITITNLTLAAQRPAVAPSFTTSPSSHPATIGDTTTFTAVVAGSAPLTYQWKKGTNVLTDDASHISGSTTATLTLTGVQLPDAGDYTVTVTNVAGSITSAPATLTVNQAALAPTITTQPQSVTVATGSSTTLSVVASGTAPLSYQWYKGGAVIADATASSLTLTNIQPTDAGSYTVVVTNSAGNATSDAATISVTPGIVTQPVSVTALTGSIATFTVVAQGAAPLSYQWYQGTTALTDAAGHISGSTSPVLTLSNLSSSDAASYTVVVSNASGSITSSGAALTVASTSTTLPTLPTIPATIYNVANYGLTASSAPINPADVRVAASVGSSGAHAATITDNAPYIQAAINDALANGGGIVEIPASAGIYYSGPITLGSKINLQVDGGATLMALPYGTYPSAANFITVPSGSSNVAITGAGVIDGNGSDWWSAYTASNGTLARPRLIQFTNASNVLISGVTLQNSPQFHIALSNANNNVTISSVTINAPSTSPNTDGIDPAGSNILIQNCAIAVGDDNIAIKASGAACSNITVSYCNFGVGHGLSVGGQTNNGLNGLTVLNCTFNGTTSGLRLKADATEGGLVQNVTYSNLTMTNVAYPIVFYSYYDVNGTPGATSGGNAVTPSTVQTYNAAGLSGTAIPQWKNITIDTLTATGATGYSIIWGLPTANGLISGVTLKNVSIGGAHGLKVYNAANVQFTGTTTFSELITYNALVLTTQPVSPSVLPAEGGSVTYSVGAAGTSGINSTNPTYQWYLNNLPLSDGTQPNGSVVTGANAAAITITNLGAANAGADSASGYNCVVSNLLDGYTTSINADSLAVSAPSAIGTLTITGVGLAPTITTDLVDLAVNSGGSATFTVVASSSTPITSYEWQKQAADLSWADVQIGASASLTLSNVSVAQQGKYRVLVWNGDGSVTSGTANLTVYPPPTITVQPAAPAQTPVAGSTVTLTVQATGYGTLTYQWKKDGAALSDLGHISGATTDTLTISSATAADNGSYTVDVSNEVGTVTSSAAVLTIHDVPAAPVATNATAITSTRFLANWNAAANATSYQLDVSTSSDFSSFVSGFQSLNVGTDLNRYVGNLSPAMTYYYRVRAVNDVGASDNSATVMVTTLALSQAPAIISPNTTTFTVGIASSFTVVAKGAPAPTYSAVGLPAWATLNTTTGVISGTAPAGTAGAQIPLTITASNGVSPDATQAFTLLVQAPPSGNASIVIGTLAGQALASGTTDGTGTAARFGHLAGLTVDGNGNIYVADTDNQVIRMVTSAGVVTTFAGTVGTSGKTDGLNLKPTPTSTAVVAKFNSPTGIAVDSAGTGIFVADTLNNVIREISSGSVATKWGSGVAGGTDGTGTDATFSGPQGIAYISSNSIPETVYVADTNNHTIRRITVSNSAVTTIAGAAGQAGSADGAGSVARFNYPSDVAVDKNGTLYVADTDNNTIRVITTNGEVRTLAGLAGSSGAVDGTGSAARFNHPSALAVDASLNVYVLDSDNHVLRKVDSAAGTVTTIAGLAGTSGSTDGVGSAARFNVPTGIARDANGILYIADTNNFTLRTGTLPAAPVITAQPQSTTVTVGATVQLFVTATGQPAPTYQWMLGGAAISGATSSTLTLSNAQIVNSGQYTVVVSNASGSVTSNAATVTVTAPNASGGVNGGGGGGGAPGLFFYAALAILGLARWFRSHRNR